MSVRGARRAADQGLDIIQEIIAATQQSHVPIAENTRIPRGLRERLVAQATQEAQAASQPLIEQLRAQLPALRQARNSEVRSIEGANEAAADAVSDVSVKGLHGLARRQLTDELASRQADILASTPLLASEARSNFQEQKAELAQTIGEAQARQQQSVASAVAAALGSARTQIHSRAEADSGDALATLEANTKERASQGEDRTASHKEFNMALAEAQRLMRAQPILTAQLLGEGDTAQWAQFEDAVASAEGIGLTAARRAVERLRKMAQRRAEQFPPAAAALGVAGQSAQTIAEQMQG